MHEISASPRPFGYLLGTQTFADYLRDLYLLGTRRKEGTPKSTQRNTSSNRPLPGNCDDGRRQAHVLLRPSLAVRAALEGRTRYAADVGHSIRRWNACFPPLAFRSCTGGDFRKKLVQGSPMQYKDWDALYDMKMKLFMRKVALACLAKSFPLGKWCSLLPERVVSVCA